MTGMEASIMKKELPLEKRQRKRSHWVVHTTMCVMFIGFSIVISGIFPYIKLLENNPQLSKTYLGWAIALNPLGMAVSSPIMGYLAKRFDSIRMTSYVAIFIFTAANFLYGCLPSLVSLWPSSAFHFLLISRFFVGISSGLVALCQSYLAASTYIEERTVAYSIMSAAQSIGFIIGPVIQMLLSLIIHDEMAKYQAAGYVSALLGAFTFLLFTPWVFKECKVSEYDSTSKEDPSSDEKKKLKPDFPALLVAMSIFFLGYAVTVLCETLIEPFLQDQYAWCDDLAVIVVGGILSATGVLFIIMFWLVVKLSKIFDERLIVLAGGFGLTVIGSLVLQPITSGPMKYCSAAEVAFREHSNNNSSFDPDLFSIFVNPDTQNQFERDNATLDQVLFEKVCSDDHECLGCPPHQTWCLETPQLPFIQLIIGFTIVFASCPVYISLSSALFSKMLGNLPQSVWMGWFSAAGSVARVVGPIYVSYIYTYLGTHYAFGILTLFVALAGAVTACFYHRLVPLQ